MTKTILRVSAVLGTVAVLFMLLASAAPAALASAGGTPVFSITADREAASTGSQIIVSVAMDNDTRNEITSFAGDLQFDTRFFRYLGFEDQISMDGSVKIVADSAANGRLSFVYTGKELTNSRINSGDSVVFIKFIFSVVTTYDTTGQFFIGTINDCYSGETNLGVIDCKAQSITVRSTTASVHITTTSATAAANLSGDARLASLTISDCVFTPEFNSEFVAYSAVVPYEVSNVRIDATASSPGAIISGLGAKDLSVGLNNFTITVLAENGTLKEYGIIISRQDEVIAPDPSATTSDTTTSSTETTSASETTTVTTTYTQPEDSTAIEKDNSGSATDDVLQIVGIVFGEIALFFFGFLSGFFVDKNLRRKGERADYDDDYYDEEDEDEEEYDRGPKVYTPSDQMYADGGAYQTMPQYADPQLIQYTQYGMDGSVPAEQMEGGYAPYPQGGQIPGNPMTGVQNATFEPQIAQFGQGQPVYPENQPMYPEDGFNPNYQNDPYYH